MDYNKSFFAARDILNAVKNEKPLKVLFAQCGEKSENLMNLYDF